MGGSVDFVRDGAVGWLTLAHPGKRNAMSRAMWRELRRLALALPAMEGLRAVVLRGADGHFCAGGDISEYPAFRFGEASLRDFHENDVWGGLQALLDCDLPLVAQIDGACMGAGMELASCCDLRIAGASARFGAPIAKLGFPMAPREAALVAGAAGALTAREMLLEAAVLDAAEMKARGFLNRRMPDDQVAAEAEATARRIAALAPQAARLNKQALRTLAPVLAQPAPAPVAALLDSAYAYADSAEHREGIAAFVEKRPPSFTTP